MWAVLVAGAAGAGKSTLGQALARRSGAALLDLDTVTNSLLDGIFAFAALPGHWNDDQHRHVVRPARYAALLDVAVEQTRVGRDVVLTAPFTAELQGGPEWDTVRRALHPLEPLVVWLHTSPGVLSRRLLERGEARDVAAVPGAAATPRIPHLALDATTPTDDQVTAVLAGPAAGGSVD